jgi:hypothetical protein
MTIRPVWGSRAPARRRSNTISPPPIPTTASYEEKSALNVSLGPTGPTSFYIGKLGTSEWTTNLDLSRPVDIGLVEPVLVALGAEYRRDTFTIGAGDPSSYINGGYVSTTGPYAGVMRAVGSQGVNGFRPRRRVMEPQRLERLRQS